MPYDVTDPAFLALQASLAGRFSLQGELGRGGMGIVYLARDVLLERPVAIKLLAPAYGRRDDMRRRFLREARIAAQCFHPHIVPIHEVAESGALAWFVMGYVPGETLADRLRRVGTLPAVAIRRIGRDIGWALAYAHERGVVHRDVKPENILLEHGTDRALIADFGIALPDASVQHAGEVAGTARFMAPEQAAGEAVDGRADLYALGVTLYLAATGRYPFDGRTSMALVAQQVASQAPAVRTLAPRLPVALADAIDQCLASQPHERFDTAAHFVAAIERTPEGGELPAEAREARQGVLATMHLADWTVSIALAGVFLVAGEESRTIGRAIMVGIVQSVLTLAVFGTALRGGETLLAARRALRSGVTPADVEEALAPGPTAAERPMGLFMGLGLLWGGFGLALAQAQVDQLALPTALELLGNVATWILPPVMVHRASTGLRRTNGLSAWYYSVVRRPLARRIVGWLGGGPGTAPRPVPDSAATEIMLGDAADAIFARLPQAVQRELQAVPGAAAALAAEAIALRARVLELSGEQRRLRAEARPHAGRAESLEAERAAVQQRLGTTIAALENVRLDLLRIEAGQTQPGALTEQLDVVRDLQRRIDAAADVRRLLGRVPPEPTPV
ncbi:MAG: serine/threonine protein kinase [Gemmatimonadetes bacterium]|jgi:serine/threonine-protein kinase|nr:serine/threonine protein kinase [Gemmatimonadota bacterium]